ncbi:MAG: hypothetical protein V4596_08320 [Bdellovibrionota bacterium]
MDIAVGITLLYAFISASFRGVISTIDRYQFGVSRQSVTFTNIYNNVLAFIISLVVCIFFGDVHRVLPFLGNIKIILFSFILQLAAHAFSYAFKHMKIPAVIIFSKMADLFIPIGIFLFSSIWNWSDFLFSVSTFLVCVPIFIFQNKKGHIHLFSALAVLFVLVIQGSFSPWFMSGVSSDSWIHYTVALIFWRLVFSLLGVINNSKEFSMHPTCSKKFRKYLSIMLVRSVLTLGAQAFLVLSLSQERPVLAWPVLNATGLISVVFSSLILREHAGKYEILAVILIAILGLLKALV